VKKFAFWVMLFGFSISGAFSQNSNANFSLSRVITTVLQKNPDVLAAQKALQAAKARLLSQRSPLSDPIFSMEYEGLSKLKPAFNGYEQKIIGIGQEIELPLKWWVKNKIASKEMKVIEMEYELVKLDKIAEAKKAYSEVLSAQQEKEFFKDNLLLAKDFLKKAKVRFNAGDVSRIEVLRAEIEVSNAERDTLQAAKNLLLARAKLNMLMAREAHAPLFLTEKLRFVPVDFDMDVLKTLMLNQHPLAKALNYSVSGNRSAVKLSALNFLPDIEIGVFRQKVRGEGKFWTAEIGFNIPIWSLFRQRGELLEAKANLAQEEARRMSVQNELILQLEDAYHQMHVAEKQVRIYTEKLLEEAEEVYRIASRSYQEGEASYLEVLEAQRTLTATRTGYVQALFEHHSTLAELERAVGGELIQSD